MIKYLFCCILIVALFGACQRILNTGSLPTGKRGGVGSTAPTGEETSLIKQAGVRRYFINVNGDNRTFLVQLPQGYNPSQSYPVIFFFHSIHGKDTGWIKRRGINEYLDTYKYIGVYG